MRQVTDTPDATTTMSLWSGIWQDVPVLLQVAESGGPDDVTSRVVNLWLHEDGASLRHDEYAALDGWKRQLEIDGRIQELSAEGELHQITVDPAALTVLVPS
jgi:hypothetical protein